MKRLSFLLLFVFCLTVSSSASSYFALSLDAAQFRGPDKQNYLEIYYSMPEKTPAYVKNADKFECSVLMNLHLFQDDTLYATKVWRVNNMVQDTANVLAGKQMIDLIRYPINPGHPYRVQLFARDLNDGRVDSIQIEIQSENLSGAELALSDLQLASNIQAFDSTCAPAFQKRFYCVLPNPEFTFGENAADLHFYFEAYNLQASLPGGEFRLKAQILDVYGKPCPSIPAIENVKPLRTEMTREIGSFSVANLPSGAYSLEYSLRDSTGLEKIKKSRIFLVHNPKVKPLAAVFASGKEPMMFLDAFDAKMLDDEFDKLYPVTKKDERKIFASIKELDAKKSFLYNYWSNITPSEYPSTEVYRRLYLEQANYVNTHYALRSKPGWKTDRGMIFLRFGKPSDIERHTVAQETNPYEIWRYDAIEAGVIFVFVDRIGFNQYELIHSTKRGELYDPNWERLLQPTANEQFKM